MLVTNAIRNSASSGASGNHFFMILYNTFYLFRNEDKCIIRKYNIYKSRHFIIYCSLGQPSDGPIGISVALSPATTTPTVSKSMITNASFRTKKLPGMFLNIFLYFVYLYYKILIWCTTCGVR